MKSNINKIFWLIIFCSFNVFGQYLRVPQTIQEQDQWCWAASSSCILNYYGNNISQCTIAEYTREVSTWHNFGNVNCCDNPNMGCDYWNYMWGFAGSIQDILQHWSISNSGVGTNLNLLLCQSEINLSHPFVIHWSWTGGGGHFLVGHGVIVQDTILYYMNPWFNEGYQIASYSWVVQNSEHIWDATTRMTSNPSFPSVPVLALPLDSSINQPTTISFLWKKCDRVNTYTIQVSADTNFSSLVINDSTLTDTIKTTSSLFVNEKYYWHVRAKNSNGNSNYSNTWNFTTSPTGIKMLGNEIPGKFALFQNYPNPFNPSTKIKFATPLNPPEGGTYVQLIIYDILGREVATLINEKLNPGTYEVEWDGSNFPSGVYFYKLSVSDHETKDAETSSARGSGFYYSETKKLVLLK